MTENKARCAPVAMATEIFKYNFYLPLTLHAETLEGDIQALSRHLAYRKKKPSIGHGTTRGILTTGKAPVWSL